MAEQEVIKHAKKAYTVWSSKEHSLWHKIKEFLLEIFIIVFAITLSIWVHGRSELAHQRKDVKEFLIGLRADLNNDIREMEEDKKSYLRNGAAFGYINSLKIKDSVNRDSLNKYFNAFFNTTGLVPNSGRYEGFKSAGKIGTIENKELQNDIMDLYQEIIPSLLLSTDYYTALKRQLGDYFALNLKRTSDSTSNMRTILKSDQVFYLSRSLLGVEETLSRYDECIRKIRKITAEIDREYGAETADVSGTPTK